MKALTSGLCLVALAACSSQARRGGDPALVLAPSARTTSLTQLQAAAPAVTELQAGHFEAAERAAAGVLAADADNPQARLVRALGRYQRSIQLLVHEAVEVGK